MECNRKFGSDKLNYNQNQIQYFNNHNQFINLLNRENFRITHVQLILVIRTYRCAVR